MKSIECEYPIVKQEQLNDILKELRLCLDTLNHSIEVKETYACKKQYDDLLKIVGVLDDIINRK